MKSYLLLILFMFTLSNSLNAETESARKSLNNDHEKAIRAVNDGEILTLDQILEKVNRNFDGRIISINLKDNEKGLFGWVYDIMIIDINNKVKQIRIDAGTSTVLSVISGD